MSVWLFSTDNDTAPGGIVTPDSTKHLSIVSSTYPEMDQTFAGSGVTNSVKKVPSRRHTEITQATRNDNIAPQYTGHQPNNPYTAVIVQYDNPNYNAGSRQPLICK